jgi:molybdate transport system ATP-binding protein
MLSAGIRKTLSRPGSPAFSLDVALEAPPGIIILFGASGAGKTTLLDCLAGLAIPNEGRIVLDGAVLFDSAAGINLAPQRRHIAYVFQTLALFPHLTVEENVSYGLTHLASAERRKHTLEILESFRVVHLLQRKPAEISGGERQRVALARSLVTSPRLLLLDEPLTALDAAVKSAIIADLRDWNAARRIPILYVTHSREEVFALGERVLILESGRIVAQGTPQEVLEAPRREPIAQLAGFENFFDAQIIELHEAQGTMLARLDARLPARAGLPVGSRGAADLEIPLGHACAGDRVRLAIRAGDILLATEPPRGLSARNILPGKILALETQGALVCVTVDCGARFTAHLTPGACRALSLAPGRPVWLIVKTHSCHVVRP